MKSQVNGATDVSRHADVPAFERGNGAKPQVNFDEALSHFATWFRLHDKIDLIDAEGAIAAAEH